MRRGVAVVLLCAAVTLPLNGCGAVSGSGRATASPPVVGLPTTFAPLSPTASPVAATGGPTGVPTGSPTASPTLPVPGNPRTLLAQAKAALIASGSVRLTGTLSGNGRPAPLDVRVRGDAGGSGWVTFPQGRLTVLRIGADLYVTADQSTWTRFTNDPVTATGAAGKYVRVTGTRNRADFARLTTLSALAADLLTPSGAVTVGPPASVRGTPAIALLDAGDGGTLYLAAAAPHLPLAVVSAGTRLDLSEFGRPVTLSRPATARITEVDGF